MPNVASNTNTVSQLNSFLRGELSAVESYRLALEKLSNSIYQSALHACERSHQDRVRILREAIVARGGEPVNDSGAWGTLAHLVEAGAAMFGERAAISALEEGEDHGRNDYHRDLDDLDTSARELIQDVVIPQQQQTHDAVRNIKQQIAA